MNCGPRTVLKLLQSLVVQLPMNISLLSNSLKGDLTNAWLPNLHRQNQILFGNVLLLVRVFLRLIRLSLLHYRLDNDENIIGFVKRVFIYL